MLEIIFLLLKILGIILLSIVGLIILLLLIVLFAPIGYSMKFDYHGTFRANVKINWLAHIIRAVFTCENKETAFKVKVLWFTLLDSNQKESGSEKSQKRNNKKDRTIFDSEQPEKHEEEFLLCETKADTVTEKAKEKETAPIDKLEEKCENVNSYEPESKRRFSIPAKFKKLWRKLVNMYKGLLAAKDNLSEKVRSVSDVINDPDNRALVTFVKEQLVKGLKIIKPSKYTVNVHFGFEDPETTGKVAVWLACLYGLMGMNLNIRPNFDEQVFEADGYMKGHIQLFGLVVIAIKCYRNKQIRKFINK